MWLHSTFTFVHHKKVLQLLQILSDLHMLCISNHLTPNSKHTFCRYKYFGMHTNIYIVPFIQSTKLALSYLHTHNTHSFIQKCFAHSGRYALNIQNYFKSIHTPSVVYNETAWLGLELHYLPAYYTETWITLTEYLSSTTLTACVCVCVCMCQRTLTKLSKHL